MHLRRLPACVDAHFCACVYRLFQLRGRIVVTGVGKSALIAQKIVATFNSTGTPALFLHAADALHGDLGMVQSVDGVLCLSNSGETPEIRQLLPYLKQRSEVLVAMVGNDGSTLAKAADFVLVLPVQKEADPHNLAPTSSTLLQLVMGDMLALCLQELNAFGRHDFAALHPGGLLGKVLNMRIDHFPIAEQRPCVQGGASLKEVIIEISSNQLGVTAVLGKEGTLIGVITDGDLRRALQKEDDIRPLTAIMIMTADPICVSSSLMAIEALRKMQTHKITQLLVVDSGQYKGVLHIHQLLAEGLGNYT